MTPTMTTSSIWISKQCWLHRARAIWTGTTPVLVATSVLNDGITPFLDGVTNSSNSTWASQLLTLNRTRGDIRLSFELDSENHDRMELATI